MDNVFTVSEVVRVLRRAEGIYGLSARSIRYYARTGMVVPSGRLTPGKNSRATRLYSLVDVALLRLVCQLQRRRVHERALWGLLIYRGEELRQMLTRGWGVLVVDDPAALAIGVEQRSTPRRLSIVATMLLHGLAGHLAAYRRAHPKVWTGLKWVSAESAARDQRPT